MATNLLTTWLTSCKLRVGSARYRTIVSGKWHLLSTVSGYTDYAVDLAAVCRTTDRAG
jgi:hypothetical protein